MTDTLAFGLLVLAVSAAALVAVQSHRLSALLRLPTPLFFLVAAALCGRFLEDPSPRTVERVVTVALVVILFDGGLHMGLSRTRAALVPVLRLGVVGTFATTGLAAVLAVALLDVPWYAAVLLATAVAPTDPAVVFSVLGQREVQGRSGTVLEGESGANDPVGIALMAALLGAGALTAGAVLDVAVTFATQMVVGLAVGVLGGRSLLRVMRSPLPAEGLYPVRTLVAAGLLFGVATVAHGSGFLAVFVAGIVLGDERAPYKREVERFHSALASLGEVVAFALLGLTVDLALLGHADVLLPGLALGLLLAVVVRPLVGAPLLLGTGLDRGERSFVLFAGLKGAVPLLLGSLLVHGPVDDGERLYAVVVVVVLVSVVLQGALVPTAAARLGVGMRDVALEPFSLGVRLRDEPSTALRVAVAAGSPADGVEVGQLTGLAEGTWVSLVVRDSALVPVRHDLVLRDGDDLLVLVDEEQDREAVRALFEGAFPQL